VTTGPVAGPQPALVVVARGASGLADPARRVAVVAAVVAAVEARTRIRPDVVETGDPADGRAATWSAVERGAPLVVVVGGDGSVRSAAAALAGSGTGLGIVPAGTGNLLAAVLGIPRRPARAAAALASARERLVDLGRARVGGATGPEAPFVVAAGIGFDARVMAATSDRRKRSLGVAAYFATAAALAVRARPFGVRIEVDGTVHETDALAVLVANTGELIPGLLGPRLPLVPDDGLLDVLVARGGGMIGGTRAALEILAGQHRGGGIGSYSARFAARRVEVIAAPDEPVEVDGDVLGAGFLAAEVIPAALRVLVPR
jgi:diacylglycerol kinase family enzyme